MAKRLTLMRIAHAVMTISLARRAERGARASTRLIRAAFLRTGNEDGEQLLTV